MKDLDWLICCSFLTALAVSLGSIPVIIKVAKMKHLMDMPNGRSVHDDNIPTLGGIAIFAALVIPVLLFSDFSHNVGINYIIGSVILLFFIGVKDDILVVSPSKKLVFQVLASLIVIIVADIRIKSFYGIFGLFEIPYIPSVLFSLFVYIVIINSFNLIDGIDGLAGGIGFIVSLTFGIWFFLSGNAAMATLSVSLAGALLGFLYFNFSKARKIFMGDTGSLIIGFIIAALSIKFIDLNKLYIAELYAIKNAPIVAVLVLSIPLFDTLRMVLIRLLTGKSPFHADKNHIHHILLKFRFSHKESSIIFYLFNVSIILLAFTLIQNLSRSASIGVLIAVFLCYFMAGIILHRWSYSLSSVIVSESTGKEEDTDKEVAQHHMAN